MGNKGAIFPFLVFLLPSGILKHRVVPIGPHGPHTWLPLRFIQGQNPRLDQVCLGFFYYDTPFFPLRQIFIFMKFSVKRKHNPSLSGYSNRVDWRLFYEKDPLPLAHFVSYSSFSLFFHIPAPCGAAEPKYLALTFDDGPSGKYTRRLLDGLAQRNARATFFLCGYRIETYPELTRELIESEHEIGLHGYSHDSMEKMSPAALNRELDQTEKLLENIAPCSVTLLRPPGGQSTKNVEKVAEQRGLSLIFGLLIQRIGLPGMPPPWSAAF